MNKKRQTLTIECLPFFFYLLIDFKNNNEHQVPNANQKHAIMFHNYNSITSKSSGTYINPVLLAIDHSSFVISYSTNPTL